MKTKLKQVRDHLDAIARILGENVPIIFLPLMENSKGEKLLKGSPAFIIRQPEYFEELKRMFEAGEIELDPREQLMH